MATIGEIRDVVTAAERERLVRWWIEESGLSLEELREIAGEFNDLLMNR